MGRVPVLCGVTWRERAEARESPVGSMRLGYCRACAHVCNAAFDERLLVYDAGYDNSLHHSATFRSYAAGLAQYLADEYQLQGKHVVELGCGKGDFLVELCRTGSCRGTGYDRSYDGRFSDERVTFVPEYMEWEDAPEFDFFAARHVLEHFADPYEFLRGVRTACGDRTVQGYVEVPDAIYDFARSGLDCIYPHVSYFSATSLGRLAVRAGFAVLRLVRNFEGQFLGLEIAANTDTPDEPPLRGMGLRREREILATFGSRHGSFVADWRARLAVIGFERCALWGAGAKGVAFLNAIDPDARLGGVIDLNPWKWNRHLPVTGHRIMEPAAIADAGVDLVITTNPAYRDEIARALTDLNVGAEVLSA